MSSAAPRPASAELAAAIKQHVDFLDKSREKLADPALRSADRSRIMNACVQARDSFRIRHLGRDFGNLPPEVLAAERFLEAHRHERGLYIKDIPA